ncbi:hypothetical protein JXB01_02945 [Candidatus Micrarchaeota archaeon]|nr:hypothetical protein [Candidatus Micrarchaeota archaeon]
MPESTIAKKKKFEYKYDGKPLTPENFLKLDDKEKAKAIMETLGYEKKKLVPSKTEKIPETFVKPEINYTYFDLYGGKGLGRYYTAETGELVVQEKSSKTGEQWKEVTGWKVNLTKILDKLVNNPDTTDFTVNGQTYSMVKTTYGVVIAEKTYNSEIDKDVYKVVYNKTGRIDLFKSAADKKLKNSLMNSYSEYVSYLNKEHKGEIVYKDDTAWLVTFDSKGAVKAVFSDIGSEEMKTYLPSQFSQHSDIVDAVKLSMKKSEYFYIGEKGYETAVVDGKVLVMGEGGHVITDKKELDKAVEHAKRIMNPKNLFWVGVPLEYLPEILWKDMPFIFIENDVLDATAYIGEDGKVTLKTMFGSPTVLENEDALAFAKSKAGAFDLTDKIAGGVPGYVVSYKGKKYTVVVDPSEKKFMVSDENGKLVKADSKKFLAAVFNETDLVVPEEKLTIYDEYNTYHRVKYLFGDEVIVKKESDGTISIVEDKDVEYLADLYTAGVAGFKLENGRLSFETTGGVKYELSKNGKVLKYTTPSGKSKTLFGKVVVGTMVKGGISFGSLADPFEKAIIAKAIKARDTILAYLVETEKVQKGQMVAGTEF